MPNDEIQDPARRLFLRLYWELHNTRSGAHSDARRADQMMAELFAQFPELAARWADAGEYQRLKPAADAYLSGDALLYKRMMQALDSPDPPAMPSALIIAIQQVLDGAWYPGGHCRYCGDHRVHNADCRIAALATALQEAAP